jgi:hypothetical protein
MGIDGMGSKDPRTGQMNVRKEVYVENAWLFGKRR